ARLRERTDVQIGILDHQVHVEWHAGDALERFHHRHADRDVGDEMTVHHVHVNQLRAATLRHRHRFTEIGEVGRQNGWRDAHAHRLTSREIGSPGPIWKPAWGLWRITIPAAT